MWKAMALLLVILLAAFSKKTDSRHIEGIKQIFDNIRDVPVGYAIRGLLLTNNLRVILVSDPNIEHASASMQVNVGSMSDPENFQGTAHLLEHIIFRGTEKYPGNFNEFAVYAQQHGGYSRGETTLDKTAYKFTVLSEFLPMMMDRLSQLFIAPSLRRNSIEIEISPYDTEFNMAKKKDLHRLIKLLRTFSQSSHDYRKFDAGSRESMLGSALKRNISLEDVLNSFFKNFYSSNMMNLVVIGRQNLSELTDIVAPLFSVIPDRDLVQPVWPEHPFSIPGYITKMVPLTEAYNNLFVVFFALPDLSSYYNNLPVAYMLELCQKISLAYSKFLKSEEINGIYSRLPVVKFDKMARGFSILNIDIHLTEKGLQHTTMILKHLFCFLNYIKGLPIQPWALEAIQERRALEQQKLWTVDSLISTLPDQMWRRPLNKVFAGQYEMPNTINLMAIRHAMTFLRADNFNCIISSKNFSGQMDKKLKWFEIEYSMANITEETIKDLKHAQYNYSNVSESSEQQRKDQEITDQEYPNIVFNDTEKQLWYKLERSPSHAYFIFKCPLSSKPAYALSFAHASQRQFVTSDKDLKSSADLSTQGIVIELVGPHNKFNSVLKRIFQIVFDQNIIMLINNTKQNLISRFNEYSTTNDLWLTANQYVKRLLVSPHSISFIDNAELEALTIEDTKAVQSMVLSKMFVESFIYGSLNEEEALKIFSTAMLDIAELRKMWKIEAAVELYPTRTVKLPAGSNYLHERTLPMQYTAAVVVCFQSEESSEKITMAAKLLSFIMAPICRKHLRDFEGMGYVVRCESLNIQSINHFCVSVEGNHNPMLIHARIEVFVSKLKDLLNSTEPKKFDELKNVFIRKRMKELGNSLTEYWNEIMDGEYFFGRENVQSRILKDITIDDLLAYIESVLDKNSLSRKKLAVHMQTNAGPPIFDDLKDENETDIAEVRLGLTRVEDIDELKKNAEFYPRQEYPMNRRPSTTS